MATAIVTGSAGLVGYETTKLLIGKGMQVIGIDNDMRSLFFGEGASTRDRAIQLMKAYRDAYRHFNADVRNANEIVPLLLDHGEDIKLIVHAAGQPSHDWSAREPVTDFKINALATVGLLELTKRLCPEAVFIFVSTNKVYGDSPNALPLREVKGRWELPSDHRYAVGVDERMSVDGSMHSPFGVSKLAGDLMVQEYGRYFGLKTACFRCGCITGGAQAGTELHGFLAYLAKCVRDKLPYTVYGYKGKQVRDNIHAHDLAQAFWEFYQHPRLAAVYNMGGGRERSCSILEAIELLQRITLTSFDYGYNRRPRKGDHKWWITDVSKFKKDYPNWDYEYDLQAILVDLSWAGDDGSGGR